MNHNPLEFLKGKAIHHLTVKQDSVEFWLGDRIVTMTDPNEVNYVKSLIKTARKWAVKSEDIYNYLEYYGAYGEEII